MYSEYPIRRLDARIFSVRRLTSFASGRSIRWHFVLNHRDNRNSMNEPSRMDWTNMAPIPSGLPLGILFVDVDSGELVGEFDYVWTFEANLNWPILKTPN